MRSADRRAAPRGPTGGPALHRLRRGAPLSATWEPSGPAGHSRGEPGAARWQRGRRLHPQALIALGLILVALWASRHALSALAVTAFVVVVCSVILHEVAHGAAAWALGDPTALRAGRLTLNPLRHVDPVGTLVLPALLALGGLGVFGYAKPVPVDPSRMRHPRNGMLLTALAGPAANLLLAGASLVVLRAGRPAGTAAAVAAAASFGALGQVDLLDRVLYLVGVLNVTLAAFNLLPVPPLDGSALVERLLPARAWPHWLELRRYAMPVLLVVVLVDPGQVLAHVLGPLDRAWEHLLAG